MNCNEVELLFAEAIGDELDASHRASLHAHLAVCESCRGEFEGLSKTVTGMKTIDPPSRLSVERIGDRLVIGRSLHRSGRRMQPVLWAACRYAASVLIAFLAGYTLHARLPQVNAPQPLDSAPARSPGHHGVSFESALVSAHMHNPAGSGLATGLKILADSRR